MGNCLNDQNGELVHATWMVIKYWRLVSASWRTNHLQWHLAPVHPIINFYQLKKYPFKGSVWLDWQTWLFYSWDCEWRLNWLPSTDKCFNKFLQKYTIMSTIVITFYWVVLTIHRKLRFIVYNYKVCRFGKIKSRVCFRENQWSKHFIFMLADQSKDLYLTRTDSFKLKNSRLKMWRM